MVVKIREDLGQVDVYIEITKEHCMFDKLKMAENLL